MRFHMTAAETEDRDSSSRAAADPMTLLRR
jgi:hypothetical protein